MRKPHISIATIHRAPRVLAFGLAVAATAALFAGVGCGGNNKPPMTPDGPEMDIDASAPSAPTAPASAPASAPTAPRKIPG